MKDFTLAECVYRLKMANDHSGAGMPGKSSDPDEGKSTASATEAGPAPATELSILSASIKTLQDSFHAQGCGWQRGGEPGIGSAAKLSKANKLFRKGFGCQEMVWSLLARLPQETHGADRGNGY